MGHFRMKTYTNCLVTVKKIHVQQHNQNKFYIPGFDTSSPNIQGKPWNLKNLQ